MSFMYLLDTNIISALMWQNPNTWKKFREQKPSTIFTCEPVIAEIAFGLELLPRSAKRDTLKSEYRTIANNISSKAWNRETSSAFAGIKARLRNSGKIILDFDIAIAAHAKAHGLILVTDNTRDFSRIPDLTLENWI